VDKDTSRSETRSRAKLQATPFEEEFLMTMKSAAWYAIAIKQPIRASSEKGPVVGTFVIRKTRDPRRIKGGRYAFGPYGTKKKACQVGSYQNYGRLPKGC
jgi:hypothetical protein